MSGMRPSGSLFLDAAIRREPAMRAPLTLSPSLLAMVGVWLTRLLVRGDGRLLVGGVLQLPDLLLEAVDPGLVSRTLGHLLGRRLRGRNGGSRRDGRSRRGRGRRELSRSRLPGLGLILVVVQARDLGLEDPHGLAEGPGRRRQLRRTEEHDDHDGDDQDLPRTIEQVAYHFRPQWRG